MKRKATGRGRAASGSSRAAGAVQIKGAPETELSALIRAELLKVLRGMAVPPGGLEPDIVPALRRGRMARNPAGDQRECECGCGALFFPTREWSRFASNACRQRAHYKRRKKDERLGKKAREAGIDETTVRPAAMRRLQATVHKRGPVRG